MKLKMPGSVKLALSALIILTLEHSLLMFLEIANQQTISPLDMILLGIFLIMLWSLLRGGKNAWTRCRSAVWIGIVLYGAVAGMTIKQLNVGQASAGAIFFLAVQFALLGAIYHGLGRESAKAYYSVVDSQESMSSGSTISEERDPPETPYS